MSPPWYRANAASLEASERPQISSCISVSHMSLTPLPGIITPAKDGAKASEMVKFLKSPRPLTVEIASCNNSDPI